ncbi:MAG: Sec-independent protein translocase protein TatB [Acidimicrobiales bacterium]
MFNIGPAELMVVLLVALLVLGPNKLPDAARQVGKAIGELRRLSSGFQAEMSNALKEPVEGKPTPSRPAVTANAALSSPQPGVTDGEISATANGTSPAAGLVAEEPTTAEEPTAAIGDGAAVDDAAGDAAPTLSEAGPDDQHADADRSLAEHQVVGDSTDGAGASAPAEKASTKDPDTKDPDTKDPDTVEPDTVEPSTARGDSGAEGVPGGGADVAEAAQPPLAVEPDAHGTTPG